MPYKPTIGGTIWTREGIEPATAYWLEAHAYWEAVSKRVFEQSPPDRELIELVNKLGASLLGVRAGLYELEIIGIEAKHGKTPQGDA